MRRKKKLIFLPLFVFVLFLFNIGWAEESQTTPPKEFEVYNLGEVVVSAEKAKVKEVAVVNEITAEDIKGTNSKTLAEALSYAPGVRVTTGSKNSPAVSIHGFAQNQILVLIDGVPYYETKYGSLDLNQIPTDNIAKIEITKGAPSVLYGANGLGGVINVITKKPSEKPYTSFSMDASGHDTYRASATHGMKAGIFNYWLNYSWAKSEGYELSDDFEPTPTGIRRVPGGNTTAILQEKGKRVNADYESHNVWAKFGIEPKEGSEYYLNFHYLDRDKAFSPSTNSERGSIKVFTDPPAFTNFARLPNFIDWGIDFDVKQKVHDMLTLKAKVFYHNHTDDYDSYGNQYYEEKLARSTFKDYIVGASLFADLQPVKWDILRFSAHYKMDNHQQRADEYLPFEESNSFTGSAGVENEFNLVKNLSVVAGISYDWFNVSKAEETDDDSLGLPCYTMNELPTNDSDAFNPMVGLTYTFPDATKIFGSVAHRTRFPTLDELYGKSGNQNLEAEASWNYTLGVSRPISTFAKAGLSVFYYDVSDLITNDDPHAIDEYNYNLGKVELFGVEVNAEVYPLDGLSLRVDYMYEESRNRSEGAVTDDVNFIPRHKVDFGIQYKVPVVKTRLNFDMTYVADVFHQLPSYNEPTAEKLKTSDYTIFDAKITQPFLKYFEIYGAVKNIFDKNYEPEVGYPAPGRSFWVGLSAKF
jgi:outer membrane cobalamin receptor